MKMPYPPVKDGYKQQERDHFLNSTVCSFGSCEKQLENKTDDIMHVARLTKWELKANFFPEEEFNNFSFLVAGGGTGVVTAFLGKHFPLSKVTHLDFSEASSAIAKE